MRPFATLWLLWIAVTAQAGERTLLESFNYPNPEAARAVWRPVEGPQVEVVPAAFQGRNVLRLPCPFPEVEERCYWDADVQWDLSRYTAFSLWVRAGEPAALRQFTLYFRSGAGWYGAWFSIRQPGWQAVRFSKADFNVEGEPAGWQAVNGIRLSSWRPAASAQATVIDIADLEAYTHDIVVVRGNLSRLRNSGEATSVERFAELMVGWLTQAGLEVGLLEDTDVERGALQGAQVALFPYNPDMSDAEAEAVGVFVASGGRILVAYQLPASLQPLLGVEVERWARAEYPGQLAVIRLHPRSVAGLPKQVTQNSWNATIPKLQGAQAIGTWHDADGRDTGWPAVTWHPHGVFFGHVLTQDDGEGKTQMLLALLAALRPELQPEIGCQVQARSGRLLDLPDGAATVAFIEQQARAHRRLAGVQPALQAARRHQERAQAALQRDDLAGLLTHARQMQAALRRAFARAFRARTPEFRAVWCHDAFGIPGWSWDQAIRHLKQHGFTAIVPNLLWGGRAYYPSQFLPTMPEVAERGDQIQQCLTACRRYGAELHPWKVNWNLSGAPQEFIVRMRREGRLQTTSHGEEIEWLCPSDPRNFELERDSMLEVVRNYAVDGIHFDYIRYPHGDSCYCDGCRERFQLQTGKQVARWPEEVTQGELRTQWLQWRQDNITRLVEAVSQEARRLRPGVKISAAVFSDYPHCRTSVAQDWVRWVEGGYLDFVCPMNYTSDNEGFRRMVANQLEWVKDRLPLYPGIGASAPGLPPEQVIWQAQLAREAGAPGFIVFNYDRTVAEQYLPAMRAGITQR